SGVLYARGTPLGVRGVRRGSRILPSPQRHGGHGGAQGLILGALSQGAGSRHSHAVGQMRMEGTGAFGAGVTLFTLFTVKYPGQKDAGMRVAHQSSLLKHPAYFTRVGPL